jgi:hypothetical protein
MEDAILQNINDDPCRKKQNKGRLCARKAQLYSYVISKEETKYFRIFLNFDDAGTVISSRSLQNILTIYF